MMKKIKFLRRNTGEYSRLGKKRKKLQKWRSPKGRDNKMRLKRKSYPPTVEVGYKQDAKTRGKIDGKDILRVETLKDLENANGKIILIGKIGKKKREEIVRVAKEKKLQIMNEEIKRIKKDTEKKENVK